MHCISLNAFFVDVVVLVVEKEEAVPFHQTSPNSDVRVLSKTNEDNTNRVGFCLSLIKNLAYFVY